MKGKNRFGAYFIFCIIIGLNMHAAFVQEPDESPVSTSEVAFTIKERDLHPESIAYDPAKKVFFLSSVHKRKIVIIDKAGTVKDFTSQGQDGLDAVLGMRVDAKNRVIWAASSALPHMTGYKKKDEGRTGVFKYHLDSKQLIKKYILHDGTDHQFDDVTIHASGDIYISDVRMIYRIPTSSDQLELFLGHSEFQGLQGIAFCDNGKKMIAADWKRGLFLIDMEKRKVLTKVAHPADMSLIGIDGLYYRQDTNGLIAIQNGTEPMQVVQFFLDKDFRRVKSYKIIEKANPVFNEPTLGVVVEGSRFYYIANSQWGGYTDDFSILPLDKLQDIVILRTTIPSCRRSGH